MPNTAATVQKSASVYACGSSVTRDDAEIANQLFSSVGTCEEVSEYLLDPITALSGSGPAYVSK
jgi:pyrroline-5-carboxylate reductase